MLAFTMHSYAQKATLMPFGAVWKYLDNGSDQGVSWYAKDFDDSQWKSGPAELGYGETDTKTVVGFGPNSSDKYPTTYFRTTFDVKNPSMFTGFDINYKRDDGIIVYINGSEIFRDNVAATGINYKSYSIIECTDDGNTVFTKSLSLAESKIVAGTNSIAIEVHQRSAGSSDITLDVEIAGSVTAAPFTLFPYGSVWKYLDNGSDQGTAWTASAFDDSQWKIGAAALGYSTNGKTPIVTELSYGPDEANKYITSYFRTTLNIADIGFIDTLILNNKFDDGLVVYINGSEVYRYNIPSGAVNYTTTANSGDDGKTVHTGKLTKAQSKIVAGANTIAVEVHQSGPTSSDIVLDMEILGKTKSGSTTPTDPTDPITPTNPVVSKTKLTRGPYLQKSTSSSIVLRWRTDKKVGTVVKYGSDPSNLNMTVTDQRDTTEHLATITGLTPYTKYYYSIGFKDSLLQGDAQNYFLTAPVKGSEGKYSFWVVGDCGNNSTNQKNVRDKFYSYRGNNITNGWLLLGDNAYSNGSDDQFRDEFFAIYDGNASKNIPLWPAPGNHDYDNGSSARQLDHAVPYYSIFETPTNGEAGGVPSNTEAFYSYDYGNIHFLSLDSYGKEDQATRLYDTTGAQVQWIKKDLEANKSKWIVAYWHHPPYTMGSHNSDSEGELASIRTNFIRILERYGVDLILCGHSHDYERSKLMKGHYGKEATFDENVHNLSQSNGRYDGTENSCTYLKDSLHTLDGTVYVVSGSAGQLGGQQSSFPHEAMRGYSNATNGGSMVLEFEGARLDAKWINADGQIRDQFTIIKDASKVKSVDVALGESVQLEASWKGDYVWSHSASEKGGKVSYAPTKSDTIVVTDVFQCISDTFKINVILPTVKFVDMAAAYCAGSEINLTYVVDGKFSASNKFVWQLSDAQGNFANAINLGSFTGNESGFINEWIPELVEEGSAYRIRLVGSEPFVVGEASAPFALVNMPQITLVSSSAKVCPDDEVTFTASGAVKYEFFVNEVSQGEASEKTIFSKKSTVVGSELISVKGISELGCSNTVYLKNITNALPQKPVITGKEILSSSAATGNQWYRNGVEIPGATDQVLPIIEGGVYKVKVTGSNGCTIESDELFVATPGSVTGITENNSSVFNINVYPNPFSSEVTVSYLLNESENLSVEILSLDGIVVAKPVDNEWRADGQYSFVINGKTLGLKSGIYILKVGTSKQKSMVRMNHISE